MKLDATTHVMRAIEILRKRVYAAPDSKEERDRHTTRLAGALTLLVEETARIDELWDSTNG